MATINIYHDEDNRSYQVTATLKQGTLSYELSTGGAGLTNAKPEIYLEITTNMKKANGSAFQKFVVRSLSDVAPSASPAADWTELLNGYVEYFLTVSELGMSSSSLSSSSESSLSSKSLSSGSTSSQSSSSSEST